LDARGNEAVSARRRGKGPLLRRIATPALLIAVPLAGLLIAHVHLTYFPDLGRPAQQLPAAARAKVQRTISFEIDGGSADLGIDLPKPRDLASPDGQRLQTLNSPVTASPTPAEESRFPGPDAWPWQVWDLKGVSKASVDVLYDFEARAAKWTIPPSDAGTVEEISPGAKARYITNPAQGREWLGSDGRYKIEPLNPVLAAKAQELARPLTSAEGKARVIYTYITWNFRLTKGDTGGEPTGAFSTYEREAGDCDEISFLYVSMLRAIGIPAWPEFGLLYDEVQARWTMHAWVGMVLSKKGGGDAVVSADLVTGHWLFRPADRMTYWVGDGVESHMLDYYHMMWYQTSGGIPRIFDVLKGMAFETQGTITYVPP
jgi:hypothetical protein